LNPKVKFWIDVYFTVSILVMPIRVGVVFALGGSISELSLLLWLALTALNYKYNEVFIATLEWIGWKSKK
jgi:hypothetical protein